MSETKYDVFVRLMSNYLVEKIQLDSITRDPHHIDIQREADSWLEEYNYAVDNAERQVGCKECRQVGSLDMARLKSLLRNRCLQSSSVPNVGKESV